MKIFLDDIRNPNNVGLVDGDYTIVRGADECIELIKENKDNIEYITFDHDLGDDFGTGADVARYIEELCFFRKMKCPRWNVHSANPVGAKNIAYAMEAAEIYSKK